MLAASIRATALALSGSALAASTLASNFAKRPVTVANMAGCLTLNSTLEWAGSADQVPAGTMVLPACVTGSTTTVTASFRRIRAERIRSILEHTTVITAGIQGRSSSRKGGEPGEPERLRPQEVAQSETYALRPLLTDRRRTSATLVAFPTEGDIGGPRVTARR